MTNEIAIVYAPSAGYQISSNAIDTGKVFRSVYRAEQFVLDLRHAGHSAWVETLVRESGIDA